MDREPALENISCLRSELVPIVYLHLKRKMDPFPPEPVALFGSRLCLSVIDIGQTWEGAEAFGDSSVFALAASEPGALPGTGWRNDAMAMLRELAEYVDLDAGSSWGQSDQIDWTRTCYEENRDARLFVNEAGAYAGRPHPGCRGIPNLALAGDFCRTTVGMTTIESAVVTGLRAAGGLVEYHGVGTPVLVDEHRTHPAALYSLLRRAYAPHAYAAAAVSRGADYARGLGTQIACQVGL